PDEIGDLMRNVGRWPAPAHAAAVVGPRQIPPRVCACVEIRPFTDCPDHIGLGDQLSESLREGGQAAADSSPPERRGRAGTFRSVRWRFTCGAPPPQGWCENLALVWHFFTSSRHNAPAKLRRGCATVDPRR